MIFRYTISLHSRQIALGVCNHLLERLRLTHRRHACSVHIHSACPCAFLTRDALRTSQAMRATAAQARRTARASTYNLDPHLHFLGGAGQTAQAHGIFTGIRVRAARARAAGARPATRHRVFGRQSEGLYL